MSYQPSHITKVDVGTPSSEFLSSEPFYWSDNVEVRFHDFVVEAARLEGTGVAQAHIFSPEFTVFGHQWQLSLIPRSIDADRVVVCIKHISDESITIRFGANTKNCNRDRGRDCATNGWTEFGQNERWGRFSGGLGTRAEINRNLVNGTLVVEVRMAEFNTHNAKPQKMIFIPENPLRKSILSKFMDEQSSDIVFEVSESQSYTKNNPKRTKSSSTFFAHRLILQDWKGVSFGELGGDSTTIAISGVKPDIFHHLLLYSYGGKIGEEVLKANAGEIIDAADKYGIVGLKLEAEASLVLSTPFTIENAMDNLLYADAKNLLVENGEEAIKKMSFGNFPGHLAKDLMTAVIMGKKENSPNSDASDLSTVRVSKLREMLHKKELDVDGSREMMIARLGENSTSGSQEE